MLNCTDTECILHHDHYYQHLHQLQQMQHHLQDHREHHGELINVNVATIFFCKKWKTHKMSILEVKQDSSSVLHATIDLGGRISPTYLSSS
jgi:hypothetical protein